MFANKTEVICTQESEENSFLPLCSMTENNLFLQQSIFWYFSRFLAKWVLESLLAICCLSKSEKYVAYVKIKICINTNKLCNPIMYQN